MSGISVHSRKWLTRACLQAETLSKDPSRFLLAHQVLEEALHHPPHDVHGHMRHCADTLMPLIDTLRSAVDGLEAVVYDADWPLPSYQEMLFMR